jgi:hypothetical protein
VTPSGHNLDYILSPRAIRERAERLFVLAEGGGTNFRVNMKMLPEVSNFVLQVTRENYPDLNIPFHSRWGHFKAGGVDRVSKLLERLGRADVAEIARTKLDLAVVSVLLDAGSGPGWSYIENDRPYARSEGLGVASFAMFMDGSFSRDPARAPLRADAEGLSALKEEALAQGFQVTSSNPLVGIEGRLNLLHRLARALKADPERFPGARPGGLYDWALKQGKSGLPAARLLDAVLRGLGSIWPGRTVLDGISLGDVWPHSGLGLPGSVECLVPFHKLSQWMTYSLIEPLQAAGVRITGIDELTGLAEYRNGGLMLDRGLIALRDPSMAEQTHRPDSELVIEWRALTIHFLDRIAEQIRKELGRTAETLPLARVLEGGTWWAGRKSAQALRSGGGPPLKIESDGTVF